MNILPVSSIQPGEYASVCISFERVLVLTPVYQGFRYGLDIYLQLDAYSVSSSKPDALLGQLH